MHARGHARAPSAPTLPAAARIDALGEKDRSFSAAARCAGLRRGELMALRWEDVDLAKNLITVAVSWDVKTGPIEPKSRVGRRTVPIASVLREYLIARQLRSGRRDGLVFGATETRPFTPTAVRPDRLEEREQDEEGVGAAGAAADRAARMSTYVRLADDRGRREREGLVVLHGSRLGDDHARPVWAPVPGQRGGSCRAVGRVPRPGTYGVIVRVWLLVAFPSGVVMVIGPFFAPAGINA